jgi:hypothetical protein
MSASVTINDLELPQRLVEVLREGRWRGRLNATKFSASIGMKAPLPLLYDLEGIRGANRHWRAEKRDVYLGTPSAGSPTPGDIDPNRSLLIGELEPDVMIALDYRTEPPSVVFCLPDAPLLSPWTRVAASIDECLQRAAL